MLGASRGMTRFWLRRVVPLAVAGLLLSGGHARAADPVYVQYACDLPDGSVAPIDGFTREIDGAATVENHCASGGGLTISLPDGSAPSPTTGRWNYAAPSGTSIARFALRRVVQNISAEGSDSRRTYFIRDEAAFIDACGLSSACQQTREIDDSGTRTSLVIGSSCTTDPCFGPEPGASLVSVDNVAITLRDEEPPTFNAHPSGDLYASGPVDGERSVLVSASDVGGGVFTAALIVDGVERAAQVLDGNGGACSKPFVRAAPCSNSVLGTLRLDTTALAEGEHMVGVVVYDATEVNRATSPPVPIQVRGTPGTTSGSSNALPVSNTPTAQGPLRLLGRRFKHGRLRQRFGQTTTIRGRLVQAGGAPAARTSLKIFSALDVPGAEERAIGDAETDAAGRFVIEIPKGPSRRIVVRSGADSWTLRVRVPAPLRLLPSRQRLRNKQKLMLVAYLLGTDAPARSADVAFQVRIGDHWRTFATRPMGGDGRARIGHRFQVTYQRLTYRFRAIVVKRKSFPFATAVSPPVAVRVN
jgi:hypothetical protein